MILLVKCLPYEPVDPSSIPKTHILKRLGVVVCAHNPSTDGAEMGLDPRGSLASQAV